jgi:hypothetical protein
MKYALLLGSPGLLAAAALSTVAFAQATGPSANVAQTPAAGGSQRITVTGCIQSEADYRRAQGSGGGGVAGTGLGVGNEFVLTSATMSTSGENRPAGTAGSAPTLTAYELTGSNEGMVAQYAGKRVEITGMLKPAEVGAAGPTGGPTAGVPPKGVDVTSRDLKLRELEVTTVRATSGSCAAQ